MLTAGDGRKAFVEKRQKREHQRVGVEIPVFPFNEGKRRLDPVVGGDRFGGENREKRRGGKRDKGHLQPQIYDLAEAEARVDAHKARDQRVAVDRAISGGLQKPCDFVIGAEIFGVGIYTAPPQHMQKHDEKHCHDAEQLDAEVASLARLQNVVLIHDPTAFLDSAFSIT